MVFIQIHTIFWNKALTNHYVCIYWLIYGEFCNLSNERTIADGCMLGEKPIPRDDQQMATLINSLINLIHFPLVQLVRHAV